MINRDRLVKTFCDLVSIDSPSGEEETIAIELVRRLRTMGLEVMRDAYGNVIATAPGDQPVMLSAHMDTVEPGRNVKPSIDGNRIVSDGTTVLGGDCKAGISVILEALESVKEDGSPLNQIEVVFTREEEPGLLGARNLDYSMVNAREAIVFDGEGPVSRITSASPTYVGFEVRVEGRSAHAGVEPEKGLSAIKIAADLVSKLPQGRLDHETTFNVGKIEGGQVRNAVPEVTVIIGEYRSINAETLDIIDIQLRAVLDEIRQTYPVAKISCKQETEFEAYTLTNNDPATIRVKSAIRSLGMDPVMLPSGGGTDGNIFRMRGISAVVVGMADHGMHTREEHVTIPDLVDAAHLCEVILRD